jgi:hypothetical protein
MGRVWILIVHFLFVCYIKYSYLVASWTPHSVSGRGALRPHVCTGSGSGVVPFLKKSVRGEGPLSLFTSRWLLTTSNGGRSPSSAFPNCPGLSYSTCRLTQSPTNSLHSTQLNSTDRTEHTVPLLHLIVFSGPRRKHHSSVAIYGPLSIMAFV